MSSIVIALPKIEDARKIRTILSNHGFSVGFRIYDLYYSSNYQ